MPVTKTYPTFVAAATASNGGVSSLVVNVPAGSAAGDGVVVSLAIRDDRTFDAGPLASFTAIFTATDPSSGLLHGCWWKMLTAADISAGSWTFTCSGGNSTWVGAAATWADLSTIIGGAGDGGDLTTPIPSGLDAGVLSDQASVWLYVAAARSSATITWTPPSGFTERVDTSYTSSSLRLGTTIAQKNWAAGDTGPFTGVASSGSRFTAGWVMMFGELAFTLPTLPANPNEVFGFEVQFADGPHTLYSGWTGAVLMIEADLGGSSLILDDPAQGLLDVNRLAPTNDGWIDLGCELAECHITAGGTNDDGVLTRMEAATCRLVLKDWEGLYNPQNTDSPYYPDWRVGTRIRVAANAIGNLGVFNPATSDVLTVLRGLFVGRITAMTVSGQADEDPIVTVECVDDTQILARYDAPEQPAVGAGDELDARVQRILDQVGYGDADTLEPDVGHPDWSFATFQATTMAQPAWTEILLSCDSVLVAPFFDGAGRLVLEPLTPNVNSYRAYVAGDTPSAGEIGLVSVEQAYDNDQLRNVVHAGRVGGTAITVTDSASVTAHGGRFRWGRTDLPLQNDSDVRAFAEGVLAASHPDPRVTAITCAPQFFRDGQYNDMQVWSAGSLISTLSVPVWYTLCLLMEQRYSPSDLLTVAYTDERSGIDVSQLVLVRGCDMDITPDFWQVRLVTSSISSYFDIWTLANPAWTLAQAELSRLSRGHRLAAV